jgi:hypothetical protein
LISQGFRLRGRKKSVTLLFWANWLLVGVAWGMSLRTYVRLPQGMAQWLSVWSRTPTVVERSWLFFIYPLAQTLFFLTGVFLARRLFFRESDSENLMNLKREVALLMLIFFNLLFIHLQTTLILVSFGLSRGLNSFYMIIVAAIVFMLIPYYRIRRNLLPR